MLECACGALCFGQSAQSALGFHNSPSEGESPAQSAGGGGSTKSIKNEHRKNPQLDKKQLPATKKFSEAVSKLERACGALCYSSPPPLHASPTRLKKHGPGNAMTKNREEIFNHLLTEVLRKKNPGWRTGENVTAEAVGALKGGGIPDILFQNTEGTPVVIESEFAPARTVEKEAQERIGRIIKKTGRKIEYVIALKAPQGLRNVSQEKLENKIRNETYSYCLFSFDGPENASPPLITRWPAKGWLTSGVDDLASFIENTFISERVVVKSLETLENGVRSAAGLLKIGTQGKPSVNQEIAKKLYQQDCEQTSRMAMAIVANALTFHVIISGRYDIKDIENLRRSGTLPKTAVLKEWERILNDVNYWPIFHIAREVMLPIPSQIASQILDQLATVSDELAAIGVTRSHDLSGRMFQRLISDRKFLATFYTLPESAALLAEIAADMLNADWENPLDVTALRIADFACGTGTLITATYQSVLARYRRAGGDDQKIHQKMMKESLIATDIMPAATHLTISMLSSVHPEQTFEKTSVHSLPYGKPDKKVEMEKPIALGALDLLEREYGIGLFGTGILKIKGQGEGDVSAGESVQSDFQLAHQSCDLVIMNPPFTRPTNHEITEVPVPSFAGFDTSEDEQRIMSRRLKAIKKNIPQAAGNGNAGLASNFLDLVHLKLKPNGILAMVMPASMVQGGAWEKSRTLLNRNYDDLTIISLSTAGSTTRAFSADTSMAEILLIGRKRKALRNKGNATIRYIALQNRPRSIAEAVIIAQHLRKKTEGTIMIGDGCAGHITTGSLEEGGIAGASDLDLIGFCKMLQKSCLSLPGEKQKYDIPIVKLEKISDRGLVDRDIGKKNYRKSKKENPRGPFSIENLHGQPTWPCLWSHNAEQERTLVVKPDSQGAVRSGMEKEAQEVWKTASTLHLNRDFRLNSQSLSACVTPIPTIGGVAWPNVLPKKHKYEKSILLWANTTLGIIMFWWHGGRQQQGRARLTISQLPNFSILDVRRLNEKQFKQATKIFNQFKECPFLPANEAYRDETRKKLDRAVLVELLGFPESILPSLDLLRRKWCAEPSVHGGKSTRITEI